jgi:RNA polymerase sigma-70 factor (ECF subfamily)
MGRVLDRGGADVSNSTRTTACGKPDASFLILECAARDRISPAEEDTAVPDAQDTPPPSRADAGTSLTLLQRLQANEPEAWRTMVQLYTPLVYQWCARGGVRGADADDVAQEVFRAAASHLDGFRRDRPGDTFRGWLRVITRNMVLLHFRRRGRQPEASGGTDAHLQMQEVADPATAADDSDDAAESVGLHRRALELVRGEFEERNWQMFWQTFIEERAPADVAVELGVTPAAVRKAKSRVLHRLKEQFADLIQ